MNGFPWLTVAGAVPLLGALVVALIPGLPADSAEADRQARHTMAKMLALRVSLLTLVVVIILAVKFQVGGPHHHVHQSYSRGRAPGGRARGPPPRGGRPPPPPPPPQSRGTA